MLSVMHFPNILRGNQVSVQNEIPASKIVNNASKGCFGYPAPGPHIGPPQNFNFLKYDLDENSTSWIKVKVVQ